MNPVSPDTPLPQPARTGVGWFLQRFLSAHRPAAPPNTDLVFPAPHRYPTAEAFFTSGLIGAWSLAASVQLCLESPLLPASPILRCLVGGCLWFAFLHLSVILPIAASPLARHCRISLAHLARLTSFTFVFLLTLTAIHFTGSAAAPTRLLGHFWIMLIMVEAALRLARAGIALASRPH